jgi:endoglucanase
MGHAMKRIHVFLVMMAAIAVTASAGPAAERDAFYWNSLIGRGVNLGNALEAPKEGDWLVRLKEDYFELIADAGFNSVRIPVRWSAHAGTTPPYTLDKAFLARVDWAVDQALSRGLVAIVNIHHYHELMETPEAHKDRFLAIWKQLSEHYRNHPERLYFEVLNEPHKNLTAGLWNVYQKEAVSLIRKSNPDRAILVAPTGWNTIDQLENLKLPGDGNLIVSIHYYEPFRFTHQGAGWVKRDWPVGVQWRGAAEEKREVAARMDRAAGWAREKGVPLNMGEFGAYSKADMASRARWTAFVRSAAEERGISWNYWEFCSSFGVYDPSNRIWRTDLLKALLPGNEQADRPSVPHIDR